MRLDYDLDADALYIKLRAGAVARTVEIDDADTFVDLSSEGALLGIEVISFRRTWPLSTVLGRYDLPAADAAQLRALFPARGSEERVEPPQMSVSRELASV